MDCYFDETNWTVRYLVVDAGRWYTSRNVLISSYAMSALDLDRQIVQTNLTRDQVKNRPSWVVEKRVSRQFERLR